MNLPVLVSLASIAMAVIAWRTSVRALHSAYRPVVRLAGLRRLKSEGGDAIDDGLDLTMMLLKNYGRGPALGACLLEYRTGEASVITSVEVIEVLGATEGKGRVGRVVVQLDPQRPLKHDREYRWLYQDIGGNWHETRFTVEEDGLNSRLLGPIGWWAARKLPTAVKLRAHFVRTE